MAQNPAKMMKQMQKLQEDMQHAQEALAQETVSASAGGGAVTVTVSGALEVMDVVIDPAALDDVELLQDTVVAATNEAMRKAQELANSRLGSVAGALGSLGIPGL
jgi:DNA-binding YbaB/EbfC family protein